MTMPITPNAPPPSPPPIYPPPHKRRHWLRWTLIGVGALVIGIIVAVAAAGTDAGKTATGRTLQGVPAPTTSFPAPPAVVVTPPPPVVPPKPSYVTPTPADFRITLKTLTKQCFGEAGCNVTFRPVLAQELPKGSFDPAVTYDVTYTVTGDESGPQTDTLYVTGDQYQEPMEGIASTPSSSTSLTVKIESVTAE
jgi:hypothetical protein